MPLYAAIDLHSNNRVLCGLDETDRIVFSRRLPNDLAKIEQALRGCPGEIHSVAIESTYNSYWLVDGLQGAGFTVHLVNTFAVKQYDGLRVGPDRRHRQWRPARLHAGLHKGSLRSRERRLIRLIVTAKGAGSQGLPFCFSGPRTR
jgi:transposase